LCLAESKYSDAIYKIKHLSCLGNLTYHGTARSMTDDPLNFTDHRSASAHDHPLNINLAKVHA